MCLGFYWWCLCCWWWCVLRCRWCWLTCICVLRIGSGGGRRFMLRGRWGFMCFCIQWSIWFLIFRVWVGPCRLWCMLGIRWLWRLDSCWLLGLLALLHLSTLFIICFLLWRSIDLIDKRSRRPVKCKFSGLSRLETNPSSKKYVSMFFFSMFELWLKDRVLVCSNI